MIFKNLKLFLLCIVLLGLFAGCSLYGSDFAGNNDSYHFQFNNEFYTEENSTDNGIYGNEMKIEKSSEIDLDINGGSDLYERSFDHSKSVYYNDLDFYNMKTKGSLKMLHNFKTYQQTGENSSGEACILAVLERYDKKGDFTEQKLCDLVNAGKDKKGTSLRQMIDIYNNIGGFKLYTTFDVIEAERKLGNKNIEYSKYFNKDFIINNIRNNVPVTICKKKLGVQWFNIIGYDDMGTDSFYDDIIIMMDSYDVTDHNQDGYSIISALQLFSDFSVGDFFDETELNDFLFVTAVPDREG